jgi:hypothetical protein
MKPKTLPLAEHLSLGRNLKQARAFLMDASCKLPSAYGKTSRVAKLAKRTLHHLEILKCELDNQVFRDHPHEAHSGIYYGEEPSA